MNTDPSHTLEAKSLWPESVLCYDLTLPSGAENLAIDDALLAAVEADPTTACLRFWESTHDLVVMGRSNRVETEVNLDECISRGVPVLRRASGGGTVIVGPGCLCYSLVLPLTSTHRQMGVTQVTAELMLRTAVGLRQILPEVEVCGTSDLVYCGQKFSGNAQRWLRNAFIHHGTLLFDFDLSKIEKCLDHPSREPAYRMSRHHSDFVTNVDITASLLRDCLTRTWNAIPEDCPKTILEVSMEIVKSRYESCEWKISPSSTSI